MSSPTKKKSRYVLDTAPAVWSVFKPGDGKPEAQFSCAMDATLYAAAKDFMDFPRSKECRHWLGKRLDVLVSVQQVRKAS